MKKIILLASLFVGTLVNAQITVTVQGNAIQDGYTFTTTSLAEAQNGLPQPNKLRFSVTNDGTEGIYVAAKLVSKSSNAPAEGTQLCFGSLCVPNINPGLLVTYYNELPAGETTPGEDDHFINSHAGTDGGPVTYNLAIVRLNYDEENDEYTEAETLRTFNYVYQPLAGLNDVSGLKKLGVTVENTIVKNSLNIAATQDASLQLFDTTGKLVKTTAVKSGNQAVELSALSAGIYLAKFTTADSKTATIKVVKN